MIQFDSTNFSFNLIRLLIFKIDSTFDLVSWLEKEFQFIYQNVMFDCFYSLYAYAQIDYKQSFLICDTCLNFFQLFTVKIVNSIKLSTYRLLKKASTQIDFFHLQAGYLYYLVDSTRLTDSNSTTPRPQQLGMIKLVLGNRTT